MAFGFLVITGVVSLSTASLKTEYWKVDEDTCYAHRCNADWSIDYSMLYVPLVESSDPITIGATLPNTLSSYLAKSAVYVGEETVQGENGLTKKYWRYEVLFESGGGTEWPSDTTDNSNTTNTDSTTDSGVGGMLFGLPLSTVLGIGIVFAGWLVYRKRGAE